MYCIYIKWHVSTSSYLSLVSIIMFLNLPRLGVWDCGTISMKQVSLNDVRRQIFAANCTWWSSWIKKQIEKARQNVLMEYLSEFLEYNSLMELDKQFFWNSWSFIDILSLISPVSLPLSSSSLQLRIQW